MEEVYISDAQFNDSCNTKPFLRKKKRPRGRLYLLFDEEAGGKINDGCQQSTDWNG